METDTPYETRLLNKLENDNAEQAARIADLEREPENLLEHIAYLAGEGQKLEAENAELERENARLQKIERAAREMLAAWYEDANAPEIVNLRAALGGAK